MHTALCKTNPKVIKGLGLKNAQYSNGKWIVVEVRAVNGDAEHRSILMRAAT